ncbi:MAG: hypothetical protein NT033_03785, partial [Candidatus Omnitrophica bacterium]|nr:hypothetical protein [Candidatus Omnitrophota bacterium]
FLFFFILIKIKDMLILGVFFSICLTVRIDLWFQIVLIILVLGLRVTRKEIGFTRLGWFFLGLVPGCGLKLINDYIKYGELRIGELNIINLRSFYFLEQLLSPYHGYVYVSPIILICLLGFIIVCKDLVSKRAPRDGDANKRAFIFLLGVTVMVKIFITRLMHPWGNLPCWPFLFLSSWR